jgi:bacterioferritin
MDNEVKGDPGVIAALNEALKNELTAIHQYMKHAHLLEDWGFAKRSKHELEEAEEERGHADRLAKRILLLGGEPQYEAVGQLYVGKSLREVIECDLRLELEGIAHYRKAVKVAQEGRRGRPRRRSPARSPGRAPTPPARRCDRGPRRSRPPRRRRGSRRAAPRPPARPRCPRARRRWPPRPGRPDRRRP